MILVVIGTSGAGKTTIGEMLASRLGWRFEDADDYHPPSNRAKLRRGTPLNDADREPWLAALRSSIEEWAREGSDVVLACSALKRANREKLRAVPELRFVYLKAAYEVAEERMTRRKGHFASRAILPDQFETLEEPGPDEPAITVDANQNAEAVVEQVLAALALR